MPTGYTAKIYDGTDNTLRGFLLEVSRGMSYSIMQRDMGPGPVERCTPSGYHMRKIQEAKERLKSLNAYTQEDIEREYNKVYLIIFDKATKNNLENKELALRYEKLIEELEAWDPDPLMESTKKYGLEQLRQSLDYDCYGYPYAPLIKIDPREWYGNERDRALQDIEYHTDENQKELEQCAERNKYIDALYRSLPE